MSLGKPIATTAHAEVYVWDEHQIVKLYLKGNEFELVRDKGQATGALQAGLPVPAVGDQIEIDGRQGLLFERVDGPPLGQCMAEGSQTLVGGAHILAELHADIHTASRWPELPKQRPSLESQIQRGSTKGLPEGHRMRVLKALDAMQDGDSVCHGDFHMANVLMGTRGPYIIDWGSAGAGNPLADVARTSVLILQMKARYNPGGMQSERLSRFHRSYLERYSELRPLDEGELAAWMPIMAAIRFCQSPDPADWLLGIMRDGLLPKFTDDEWQALRETITAPILRTH